MLRFLAALVVVLQLAGASLAQDNYKHSADSRPNPAAPQGEISGPFPWKSKIFPGTERNYWLYLPAQYDAKKKTCVLVVQDGLNRAKNWKLPTVMDNLIHKQEMPPTIGIFISPGVVPASRPDAQPRFNRSFEYDGMGDRYARFLLHEILPEVGKKYNLSQDPNDRAIAGASSGGICAFTVAWERPNEFRRVLSTIGTFVSLRGGNEYAALIRKTEPKPIRVFLQDGSNDLDIYGGSWWVANQDILAALKFSGYDVRAEWGKGGHNGKHAAAIMPSALRWLWRDYPAPIRSGANPKRRTNILIQGEDWELVSAGHRFTEGPAVNVAGEVYFTDIPNNRIHKIGLDGKVTLFAENTQGANGLMFSPDGSLYACQNGAKRIVRYDDQGKATTLVENAESNDLVVLPSGIYYTDPRGKKVWFIDPEGKRRVVDSGVEFPNGVVASPDQSLLFVSDTKGRFVYSYQIQQDGSLAHKQRFGHVHLPDNPPNSGADGMTVDQDGRLYLTTRMGIQVLDQLGRCHLILLKPQTAWVSNVVFGGPDLDTLFVTCGDKVYRRRLRTKGVIPWKTPQKPPRPNL